MSIYFFFYHPDDVGRKVGHLFGCQPYTYCQVKFIGCYGRIVHQVFKLFFIAGKACQILFACQVQYLIANQLLFGKAVTQAFHNFLRIAADAFEQVVAGKEVFIIVKARVHFNKIVSRWVRRF